MAYCVSKSSQSSVCTAFILDSRRCVLNNRCYCYCGFNVIVIASVIVIGIVLKSGKCVRCVCTAFILDSRRCVLNNHCCFNCYCDFIVFVRKTS